MAFEDRKGPEMQASTWHLDARKGMETDSFGKPLKGTALSVL